MKFQPDELRRFLGLPEVGDVAKEQTPLFSRVKLKRGSPLVKTALDAHIAKKDPSLYSWYKTSLRDEKSRDQYLSAPYMPRSVYEYTHAPKELYNRKQQLKVSQAEVESAIKKLEADRKRQNEIFTQSQSAAEVRLEKFRAENAKAFELRDAMEEEVTDLVKDQRNLSGKILNRVSEIQKLRSSAERKTRTQAYLKEHFPEMNAEGRVVALKYLKGEIPEDQFVLEYHKATTGEVADAVIGDDGSLMLSPSALKKIQTDKSVKSGKIMQPLYNDDDAAMLKLISNKAQDIINGASNIPSRAIAELGTPEDIALHFTQVTTLPKYKPAIDYAVQEIISYLNRQKSFEAMGMTTTRFLQAEDQAVLQKLLTEDIPRFLAKVNWPATQKEMYLANVAEYVKSFFNKGPDGERAIAKFLADGQKKILETERALAGFAVKAPENSPLDQLLTQIIGEDNVFGVRSFIEDPTIQHYIAVAGNKLKQEHPDLYPAFFEGTDIVKLELLRQTGIVVRATELIENQLLRIRSLFLRKENELQNIGFWKHWVEDMEFQLAFAEPDYVKVLAMMKKREAYERAGIIKILADSGIPNPDVLYDKQMTNPKLREKGERMAIAVAANKKGAKHLASRDGFTVNAQLMLNNVIKKLLDFESGNSHVFAQLMRQGSFGVDNKFFFGPEVQGVVFDPRTLLQLRNTYGIEFKTGIQESDGKVLSYFEADPNHPGYANLPQIKGMISGVEGGLLEGVSPEIASSLVEFWEEMQVTSAVPFPFELKDAMVLRLSDKVLPVYLQRFGLYKDGDTTGIAYELQDSGQLRLPGLFGYSDLKDMNPQFPADPVGMLLASGLSMINHNVGKAYFVRMFWDDEFSISNMFHTDDPQEAFQKYKQLAGPSGVSGITFVVFDGQQIRQMAVDTPVQMARAMQKKAIVVSYMSYKRMFRIFNSNRMNEALKFLDANLNPPFKAAAMTNPMILFRNFLDNFIKYGYRINWDPRLFRYISVHFNYRSQYQEILGELSKFADDDKAGALKYFLSLSPDDQRIFDLMETLRISRASGSSASAYMDVPEIKKNLEERQARSGGRGLHQGTLVQRIAWGNAATKLIIELNGEVENTFRGAMFLYLVEEEDLYVSQATQEVGERFFEYDQKTPMEENINAIFMFQFFKTHNALFWADHALDNPALLRALLDAVDQSWLEHRRQQQRELSDYQLANYSSGNPAFGTSLVKLNPSIYDALMTIPNLIMDPFSNLTPVIENVEALMSGDLSQIQMPWDSQVARASKMAVAGSQILNGEMAELSNLVPGLFGPNGYRVGYNTPYTPKSISFENLAAKRSARKNYYVGLRGTNYYRKNYFNMSVGKGFKHYKPFRP